MGKSYSAIGLLAFVATGISSAAFAANCTDNADYVVVGGGPAGVVIAERLSRDGTKHVVLLEAGPEIFNSTLLNTPAYFPFIAEPLWNYTVQPDANLAGNAPGVPQGRVLGGGTAVNGMAYCRGAASVFDEWATISGNPGLAWDSLLQDFHEVSHYTDPPAADYEQFVNLTAYGDGPLEVSRASGLTGFEKPFASSIQSKLGLRQVDLNDGTGTGIDMGVSSIFARNRTRSYARSAYAPLMEGRPNLQISYGAWVSSIGFSGNRAVNATYHSDGEAHTIKGKEFIISAGALNTPKLLLLSGVGPKEQLGSLGIQVVLDQPHIGENLRDHALSVIQLLVTPEVLTVWQWSSNTTEEVISRAQYAANASGPLGWCDALVFATFRLPDSVWDGLNDTHYTSLPSDRPHALIQFTTIPFLPTNSSAITAWASLVQPETSGRVVLGSSNYQDDPLIYANYYGTKADKAAIIAAYQSLREVMKEDPVSSLITEELYPGSAVSTDDEVWAAIQNHTYSFRHPVGTVALGTALDSNWRLKGLEGIRVVDSSTFPFPTTCHPQSVLYALANRAAKDILQADGSSNVSIRYPLEAFFEPAT
ncbi:Choline dehydrogenase, mitochondrial [Cytospora mali]|uniref:Choline dehydrogenase, mitochondrial n=1 Tax=Cytospora mali TaxID=578113 RepID=A0A194UQ75_CYTMA|nr:Choline dehydrogenase, mitochondrial [Valsa mali var. pyri (nom. inval.)]